MFIVVINFEVNENHVVRAREEDLNVFAGNQSWEERFTFTSPSVERRLSIEWKIRAILFKPKMFLSSPIFLALSTKNTYN